MILKLTLDGQNDSNQTIDILKKIPTVEILVDYPTGKEQDAILRWAKRNLPSLVIKNNKDGTVLYISNKLEEFAQENVVIDVTKVDGNDIRRLIEKGYITLGR